MERQASIHITEKQLSRVLRSINLITMLDDTEIHELANEILERGKPHSLTDRTINVDKAKLYKSTSRIILSTRDDASVFCNLLLLIRRKKKHQGISIIKPSSTQWLVVKEITKLALDFCNDFGLKREEGFKAYIILALDKMGGGFSLNKFNRLHQYICEDYKALDDIKKDLTPQQTITAKVEYEKLLGEKGIVRDYSMDPSKLVYFLRAKEEANKHKVPIPIYIKAQFDGLEWANSYPEPNQLVEGKAIDRMYKYLSKIGYKPGNNVDTEKIKKLADDLKAKWKNDRNKNI